MNKDKNVQTNHGGDQMNENQIDVNGVIYEVKRIHHGHDTACSIVSQRIMEAKNQLSPLTKHGSMRYNNNRGAGMSKEAR